MDASQTPPRILYVATWTVTLGVLGSLFCLMTAPPAAYAQYQPFFQAAFDLVIGCIFIAWGLFYHSWFATIMGAHKAPAILHFGPNGARIGFVMWGLVMLALGIVRILLHR